MKVVLQTLHRAEIVKLLQNSQKTTGFILDLVYMHTLDSTLKTAVFIKPRLKSIQRNRVKRLVRQAFITLAPGIKKGGFCIAVIKKTPASFEENIQSELESLFRRAAFL